MTSRCQCHRALPEDCFPVVLFRYMHQSRGFCAHCLRATPPAVDECESFHSLMLLHCGGSPIGHRRSALRSIVLSRRPRPPIGTSCCASTRAFAFFVMSSSHGYSVSRCRVSVMINLWRRNLLQKCELLRKGAARGLSVATCDVLRPVLDSSCVVQVAETLARGTDCHVRKSDGSSKGNGGVRHFV